MFSLKDKITLVTGAGSGIGAAIAETFVKAGGFVFVTDRDEQAGQGTVNTIRIAGGQGEFLALDVSSEADCARVGNAVKSCFGRLDVLVNNAGIGHVGTMLTTTGADLDRLWSVNVRGVFNVTKVFLPGMVERQSGSIVNIAGMTKALARGHARGVAVELRRAGAFQRARWTLCFYVPRGTKIVGGFASGPGTLVNVSGRKVHEFDAKPGYFSVPVEAGQDGKLWQFQNTAGTRMGCS